MKREKYDWNAILAVAIASNEVVFFEGQRVTQHNKKDILTRLLSRSKKMTEQDNFSGPTREDIAEALRVPEVEQKLDSLGRVSRKKNPAKSVLKWSAGDDKTEG